MNYYRRYIGDFQRDTGHLSLAEVGAYDRLLDHYYATEALLPGSLEVLCRIARAVTKDERAAVQEVADQFFPLAGAVRSNRRADKEIATSQKARDNGAKGGRPITGSATGELTGLGTGAITGMGTGDGGGSGHPPATSHQPSTTSLQPPSTKPRAKAAGRGARLPADWKPDVEQVEFCRQERPDLNADATAARFRDYWIAQPGAKGLKLDWTATWRNWVRNERPSNGAGQSVAEKNKAAAAEFVRRGQTEKVVNEID